MHGVGGGSPSWLQEIQGNKTSGQVRTLTLDVAAGQAVPELRRGAEILTTRSCDHGRWKREGVATVGHQREDAGELPAHSVCG